MVFGNFLLSTFTYFILCLACDPPFSTLHLPSGHNSIPSLESLIISVSPAFHQGISSGSQLTPNVSVRSLPTGTFFFPIKNSGTCRQSSLAAHPLSLLPNQMSLHQRKLYLFCNKPFGILVILNILSHFI